ncbi:MAG TPA: sugar kinase [Burkholderiaceae bacterium]|nr:sugar kinase [Burkholderiaceae bacterium]
MKDYDLVALGEPMLEFNQTVAGEPNYRQGFGGDTSNAIIAAARQGARCAYLSRVGKDTFGDQLRALWQRESVDHSGVLTDLQAPTGIYFVSHGPAGHTFSYLRAGSAASRMQPADLAHGLIERSRFLHVSAISQAISTSACDTVFAALARARAAGTLVSYDSNLRLRLWPVERARAMLRETLDWADWFLPSLEDMQALTGLAEPAAILDWSRRAGARRIVLKLGAAGAIVDDGGERRAIAPHRVEAVDATGAGDCFAGNFLARLIAGDTPAAAARWANAAAALATLGFGAVDPLPRPEQVRAALGT